MDNIENENINSTNNEDANTETLDATTEAAEDIEITLDGDSSEIDVNKVIEQNKKLFARAKKAEELLKQTKAQDSQPKKVNINNKEKDYLTREEAILIAKGLDESALDNLKVIAKGKGISLLEAQKDPMFEAFNAKLEEANKQKKAQLGASKGSGLQRPEKSVAEMTPEEHKAYVTKLFSK